MLWTAKDDETIRQCRRCLENCRHYNTLPAAWFTLNIRMYEALKDAGLLERQELTVDYCVGCAHEIGGACKKAYAEAILDEGRKKVVSCKQKTIKTVKKETRPAHSLAAGRSRP